MTNEINRLLDADTIAGVCSDLSRMLAELREHGYIDRLPAEYRTISARSPTEIRRWCEVLAQSSLLSSGRLDIYFSLFDAARARIQSLDGLLRREIRCYEPGLRK